MDPSNPFATPHPTPGGTNPHAYQPPPPEMGGWGQPGQPGTGNTTSMYGTANTHPNSMYGAPPNAPPQPGGYKGHAEVY